MQTKLGRLSNVKALRRIFDPQGLHLVDIGCGAGDLARKLAYVGATVIGIEPDTIQAQKNALAPPWLAQAHLQPRCSVFSAA